MRLILAFALVLTIAAALPALAGGVAPATGGARFVPGLEDVPLMPGLEPVDAQTLEFDTPGGRIVESYATGAVTGDAVAAFYERALPQLGWARVAPHAYRREGEALKLEVVETGTPLTVRFRLDPTEAESGAAPPADRR